ncbi:SusC/RagA family TonB-linked outer membrane protein [Kaistella jeonii]|uniref:SusC/RagA family TonB-linked outer membrane protein n=1 Tax=Kaistella jeonii TaxID=266749 RepID=UPI0008E5DD83|nr:SusC/RagA family TonB-linked outer membrane protein [Kaistella jeonii]SFC37751.1 TonB-linked outer membrane protein, SusC/RagA family [Kaistella jeonii]VEI96815.1 Outer membrane receptor for ferrienterochelin and colicins [Kaistella jeonii]
MKKITTTVLAVVLTSSFALVNAQKVKDTIKTQNIGEVIITGALGIKKKADAITNAQQIVGTKELNQGSAPGVTQALQGKVSGLQISNTNSAVDPSYKIILRGSKSITGNNQALVVIDNVISDAAILNALPPEVIENVNVIKGLQGAALYGSQGVNGVILVTTKRGTKSEKIQFNLTSSVEVTQGFKFPNIQKRYGKGVQDNSYSNDDFGGTNYVPWENTSWGPAYTGALGGQYVPAGLPQPGGGFIYEKYAPVDDHFSKFFTNGVSYQNGLSVNVGGADSYAFMSINRLENNFVVEGDQLKQNNFLFKAGKKFGKLRVDGQFNFLGRVVDKTDSGLYDDLLQMPSTNDIRKYRNSGISGYLTAYSTNPYWTIEHARFNSTKEYLSGLLSLEYEFNKNISLSYTGNLSLNKVEQNNHNDGSTGIIKYSNTGVPFLDANTLNAFGSPDVTAYFYNRTYNDRKYYGDLMLNLNYDLTSDINLKLNLGNNIQDSQSTARTFGGSGLYVPGWYNYNNVSNPALYADTSVKEDGGYMDNYTVNNRVIAGYANLDLAYKDYLFVNGTFRYEKSSVLTYNQADGTPTNKAYPYYSAGLSFVPTKAFNLGGNVLNYLKIAPSYTRVGNTSGIATYALNATGTIPTGYPANIPSYILNTAFTNPDIRPEYVNTADLNVIAGFFKDRLTIDASIYQSTTEDLISNIVPSSASGLTAYRDNIGKSQMKGYEVNVGLVPIKTQDFTWNLNGFYSSSKTKLVELNSGADRVALLTYTTPSIGIAGVVGEDFYSIVGTSYRRDPNGNVIVNASGVPLQNSGTSILGSVNPDYTIGINTAFKYKGLTLSAVAEYRKGGKFVSFTKRLLAFTGGLEETADQDRSGGYIVPNSVQFINGNYVANTTPAYSPDYGGVTTFWTGSAFRNVGENLVVDATFFKVREIALSYDLPKSVLSSTFLNNISVSLYARNPIAIYAKSNRNFGDPESSTSSGNGGGIADTNQYPTTRTFGFKINANF